MTKIDKPGSILSAPTVNLINDVVSTAMEDLAKRIGLLVNHDGRSTIGVSDVRAAVELEFGPNLAKDALMFASQVSKRIN